MIDSIILWGLGVAKYVVGLLPSTEKFVIPAEAKQGLSTMLSLIGWVFPYSWYAPLLLFIVSFTSFQIANAFIKRIRKG